jgi:hypothetical protein
MISYFISYLDGLLLQPLLLYTFFVSGGKSRLKPIIWELVLLKEI